MKKLALLLLVLFLFLSCTTEDLENGTETEATTRLCSTNSNGETTCVPPYDNGED